MATRREPRFKLSRRLGVNIYGHPKAMNRAAADNCRKGRKLSNYGQQLLEKQKLKAYYGIFEKQMLRYVKQALKSGEMTGTALVKTLECRLDNLVYRIGFANSIRLARQLVSHGHILVNGRRLDIPSYIAQPGDVISLREKSRRVEAFAKNFTELKSFNLPYIEKDFNGFSATLARQPQRDEVPIEVDDILVVEYYSK